MARLIYCDDRATMTLSWGAHTYTYEALAAIFGPVAVRFQTQLVAGIPPEPEMGPDGTRWMAPKWGPIRG